MKTEASTYKAVVYCRVSTEEQAQSGTSLEGQFAACLAKAESLSARIANTYEDAGVSGAYYQTRPGLQAALSAIESGKANCLIVANVSRLSRDTEHQAAIMKRVKAAGGQIIFVDMTFDATPEGGLAFGIMGSFAQYERQIIRERTTKGRQRRAGEGIQTARTLSPYGYHIPTHADVLRGTWPYDTVGTYQIVEERAAFIREAFTRCASGDSLRSISQWLTAAGAPTSQGGKMWYQTSLLSILRNPVYKGTGVYGRHEHLTDERRLTERGLKIVTYKRLRAEQEWQTFPVPPLVEEEIWNACQKRLDSNQARMSGNPKRRYLLSGVARCGLCGSGMMGFRTNKLANAYYRCRDAHQQRRDGKVTCDAGCVSQEELEALMKHGFITVASSPDMLIGAFQTYRERRNSSRRRVPTESDRAAIETELAGLDRREKATIKAQIAGISAGASPEFYGAEFAEIARLRAALVEKQNAVLPEVSDTEPEKAADIAGMAIQALTDVLNAPEDKLSVYEKHGLISRVVEKVVPDSGLLPETCTVACLRFSP